MYFRYGLTAEQLLEVDAQLEVVSRRMSGMANAGEAMMPIAGQQPVDIMSEYGSSVQVSDEAVMDRYYIYGHLYYIYIYHIL